MDQARLTELAILSIERKLTEEIDFNYVIKVPLREKPDKVLFEIFAFAVSIIL